MCLSVTASAIHPAPSARNCWKAGEALYPTHPSWTLEAHYLALGLVSFICTLMPQRIVMGGGVMRQTQLWPLLRCNTQDLLNSYLQVSMLMNNIDTYIVPPELGEQAGVLGAIALARHRAAF